MEGGICADSLFSANGKVKDESMQVRLSRCDNGKGIVDEMKEIDAANFNPSTQVLLSSRVSNAKENGLKHFQEKAKGSMNLRRECESLLKNKIDEKTASLRSDWSRFEQSWIKVWRVEVLLMNDS